MWTHTSKPNAARHDCETHRPSSLPPEIRLRVVAVLCSVGFLPWLTSSASSTSSHAAAKMASSPCSCQNSISNERCGNSPRLPFFFVGWVHFHSLILVFSFQNIRPNGCFRLFHYSAINTSDSRGCEAQLPQRDHSVRDCADQPPGLGFRISSDFQRSHSRNDQSCKVAGNQAFNYDKQRGAERNGLRVPS